MRLPIIEELPRLILKKISISKKTLRKLADVVEAAPCQKTHYWVQENLKKN